MKLRTNQSGFSAVEIVIVLVIVGAIGLVGYTVYNRQQDKATDGTSQQSAEQSPTATDVQSAPEVKSTEDLDKAEAVLDATDPGSSNTDAGMLDSETSAF
jgi:prepilin-type N-terminal cleavage/methylation domain-containing protein